MFVSYSIQMDEGWLQKVRYREHLQYISTG